MKRQIQVFAVFILVALVGSGCNKSSGSSLGVGQLLPPVLQSLPTSLSSSSAAASRSTELDTIVERFFTDGPTDFLNRLSMVDSRLLELDNRNKESTRTCIGETAQEWAISGLPDSSNTNTRTFPMYFNCQESMSRGLMVYFGRKDGYSYVAELQVDDTGETPTMAVLGKVDDESTHAEVWQLIISGASQHGDDNSKKRSAWLYVKGNKSEGTFQLASAATGTMGTGGLAVEPFNGVGCGVRLNLNEDLVYGVGLFTDFNMSTGSNCSDTDTQVCANATDLTDAGGVSNCTSASLNTFATTTPHMTWEQLSTQTGGIEYGYTKALEIIEGTGIPTLTDFNSR